MSNSFDPRILFAAERTLMAWNRTSLSLMTFGFIIDRFGLYLHISTQSEAQAFQRELSHIIGLLLICWGSFITFSSVLNYIKVLKILQPSHIPPKYYLYVAVINNLIIGILGILITIYLIKTA